MTNYLTRKDSLKMIFVAFLWALCFPLIKLGLASGTSPIFFGALRALIAAVALCVLARIRGESLSRIKVHWRLLVAIGVTAFLGFAGMFLGGASLNPGIASVIGNSNPIMASILAVWFLSEKLTAAKSLGLILGFMGVILISIPAFSNQTNSSLYGIGYVLLGALSAGAGSVLLKKVSLTDFSIITLFFQFALAAILLFLVSFAVEGVPKINLNFKFIMPLMVLAVGTTAYADVLWIDLLKRNSISKLSIFMFLTPAFSIIMGIVFFNESFGVWEITGILTIVSAIFLNIMSPPKVIHAP